MKKHLQIVCCFAAIFAIMLLSACEGEIKYNSNTSSIPNSTSGQYESSQTDSGSPDIDKSDEESSQTDSTTPNGDDAQQNISSDSNESTDNDTKPNTNTGTDTDNDKPASSTPPVSSTPSDVHTHTYSTKTVAATCTKDGYTLKSCDCGYNEKIAKVSALGHSWGDWITVSEATTTSTGLQRRTCIRCGDKNERTLEKLPQSASEVQMEILRLVNEEREKQGLNALKYYYVGQSAADIRANEITTVFDHTRPDGTSCFTVFSEVGIEYRRAGENLAKGYKTAEAAMYGWMNSEGHRKNILNENYTHIIVAVVDRCWVQLFLQL